MHRWLPLLLLFGCADRVRIDDGQSLNGVIQIQDWFTSFFVRPTDGGAILIDAGFRAGPSEGALAAQDVSLDQVTDVFLTHGHGDHLGLLPQLSNATIHALGDDVALVAEESETSVTNEVTDGEVLEVGATVEVFSVPGHTAGSAVYLIDGVLLLGDSAIVNRDGLLVPVNEDRSDDPAALVDSMQALAERLEARSGEIDWLAPAHSAPVAGFGPLQRFPEQ